MSSCPLPHIMEQWTMYVPAFFGVNFTSMVLPGVIIVLAIPSSSDLTPWTPSEEMKRKVVSSPTCASIFAGVNFQFATAMSIAGWAEAIRVWLGTSAAANKMASAGSAKAFLVIIFLPRIGRVCRCIDDPIHTRTDDEGRRLHSKYPSHDLHEGCRAGPGPYLAG